MSLGRLLTSGAILGFFFLLGAYLLNHARTADAQARAVQASWRETPATVLTFGEKSTRTYDKDKKTWSTTRWKELTYAYEVAGRRYAGNQYDVLSRHVVPDQLSYASGQTLRCFVNPATPSEAVLSAVLPDLRVFYVVSALFMGIPLLLLPLLGWRYWRGQRADPPVAPSEAS